MSENPYDPPTHPPTTATPSKDSPGPAVSSGRAAYNIASDTVTGVNVRWSDNKFQAVFVFASVVLLASAGTIFAVRNPRWDLPWFGGAMLGTLAGLVIGIFSSGIFLMVYRMVRHIQGKHD